MDISKLWKIKNTRFIQYNIVICSDIFNSSNDLLLSNGKKIDSRRFVVIDSKILDFYAEKIVTYFKKNNISAKIIPFVAGEKNKSLENYTQLLNQLDKFPINRRNEPIIVIGGGVLTDIVGFVASSYRRGVPYIKVPTTLMGYVDASIGIKTGINFNNNKNRVGSFYSPVKVLLDKSFFITQNKRHILNGVAEILKLAVIKDRTLFELLEQYGKESIEIKFQNDVSELILYKSIELMIEELNPNLFEENLFRVADFGHTFSTIFEMHDEIDLLHGEAVIVDIVFSCILSYVCNILSSDDLYRILHLIRRLELFIHLDFIHPKMLWEAINERAYHRNGLQRLPLPCGIGEYIFVNDMTYQKIEKAFKIYKNSLKNPLFKLASPVRGGGDIKYL